MRNRSNLNPFYAVVAEYLLPAFVRMQWLPLLLAGIYLGPGRPWLSIRSRLLVLYWAASSLSLLGLGKIGAGSNYWIELAAATAILAARGAYCVVHLTKPGSAAAGAAALFVAVAFQLGGPPSLLASAQAVRSDARSLLAAGTNVEFDSLVDRVRREPRDVLAEPMDVLVLAGRPVTFEPFIYSVRLDMGRWQPNEQVARIHNGDVGLVVLGYSLEVGAGMTDGLHALWPPPVMAACVTAWHSRGYRRRATCTRRVHSQGLATTGPDCADASCRPSLMSGDGATIRRDHVRLSITSFDRLYPGGYAPSLQTPGQVVACCRDHLGQPIASPALFGPVRDRFIRVIETFATQHQVPLIHFARGQGKDDVAAWYRARFAGEDGVVFIGVAQERARASGGRKRVDRPDQHAE